MVNRLLNFPSLTKSGGGGVLDYYHNLVGEGKSYESYIKEGNTVCSEHFLRAWHD